MSRVGQMPVTLPEGVEVAIAGREVSARGKLGALSMTLSDQVELTREDDKLTVAPRGETKRARSMWGTTRSLLQNIVTGVSEGFRVELAINGVGYRAAVDGGELVLQLGYSHEIRHPIPEGIAIACERPTHIAVSGIDRQQVGQVAAEIRAYRKPEPYKGKGIRYANEIVVRKEGKKK
ncbi:MAG: 50S ribosomal protein L6 [Defluviicoccus sp.]|nr:50S ribosomal protein L6 [Defluviicoccus sp.]MDE0383796.1 50S ribosomal protein L6 [Defluviicoccus sp.]